MNPNPDNKRIKLVQYATTAVLVVILGAMVAGYIYYGMYAARNIETTMEPEATTTPGMDEAKRQEIINALGQETDPLSSEKKGEIIDSLTTQSNQQLSPEAEARRKATIESLQQN
jgi:hypothetical protein